MVQEQCAKIKVKRISSFNLLTLLMSFAESVGRKLSSGDLSGLDFGTIRDGDEPKLNPAIETVFSWLTRRIKRSRPGSERNRDCMKASLRAQRSMKDD